MKYNGIYTKIDYRLKRKTGGSKVIDQVHIVGLSAPFKIGKGGDEQMKILDVRDLSQGIWSTLAILSNLQKQIVEVDKDLSAVVGMENSLQGETGESIRSFYRDHHIPFVRLLSSFLANYESRLKELEASLALLESEGQGHVREDYLENEIDYGLNNIRMMAIALTNETNFLLDSIKDIVDLPKIQDKELLDSVNEAKTNRNRTLDKLHEFDNRETAALSELDSEMNMLANYITNLQGLYQSGELRLVSRSEDHIEMEQSLKAQ